MGANTLFRDIKPLLSARSSFKYKLLLILLVLLAVLTKFILTTTTTTVRISTSVIVKARVRDRSTLKVLKPVGEYPGRTCRGIMWVTSAVGGWPLVL